MEKRLILRLFSILLLGGLSACSTTKKPPEFTSRHKNIYAEFLGTGGLVGIHYDMRLKPGRMDGPGFKAGIGGGSRLLISTSDLDAQVGLVFFPLEFNYLKGSYRGSMIIGAGLQPMYFGVIGSFRNQFFSDERLVLGGGYIKWGWRFQPIKSTGLMGEIHWNPHFIRGAGLVPLHVGIGLGVGFK